MSLNHDNPPISPGKIGPDLQATARTWVDRRAAGMTAAQRDQLRKWLAEDRRHAAAFAQASSSGDDCDWAWETGAVDEVVAGLKKRAAKRRRRAFATASALAVLLVIGLAWQMRPENKPSAVVAAPGFVVIEPKRQTLPDNSVVEMKEGAEIAVAFTPSERRVILRRGEAHFRVTKDPARHFIVEAGGVAVRAVGTEFAVQVMPAAVEVLVTEGQVAVEQPVAPASPLSSQTAAPAPAFVDAGRRTVVTVAAQVTPPVESISDAELQERLGWRIPRLEFTATPLREVITRMNQHNRKQFVLGDPTLGAVRVSGVLRADKTDSLIELLESDFGIKAEQPSDREIVLRRKS